MATAVRQLTAAEAVRAEVDAYLDAAQRKSLLRFITCGSVDDGKSTLIGRLLFDSKMLFEDQLAALASESRSVGTQGGNLDFALLVDGLGAEREQGITIDVAYRFFTTDKRKFIVADTPGHEQYTRNMVTGASTADLAIILIDARKGVQTQTRRHSLIAKLLGIRHFVLAINKMDLVEYSHVQFEEILLQYREFAGECGISDFTAVPLSGLTGDNVTTRSPAMPWYEGPSLLDLLETVSVTDRLQDEPFRLPVQWVNRPDQHFRGFAGRIATGRVRPGDSVTILPSGATTTVERIVGLSGDRAQAVAGQSVTLTLAEEVDCSRGDIIVASSAPLPLADELSATLVWMAPEKLAIGRSYWLKIGTRTVSATIPAVEHVLDINSSKRGVGGPLALNDIGQCQLHLDRVVPAVRYDDNRKLGAFILIDKISNSTVAAGTIGGFAMRTAARSSAQLAGQVLWIVSDSAAERAAGAAKARQRLEAAGRPVMLLSERSLEGGLFRDLGNSAVDRAEALRRVGEVAQLVSEAGVSVLIAIGAALGDTLPGKRIEAADLIDDGDSEWVI